MATIKVTPDSLRSQAKTLLGHKSAHDSAIASFKSVVNGTASEFTGEAAEAYRNQFASMEPTLKNFSQMLENFSKELDNAANIMEQTDKSLASSMKPLG